MTPLIILKKLFLGGTWFVGIRDLNEPKKTRYTVVSVPEGQWVADPFLFEENGHHYLFCEQYITEQNRAGISCFEIIDGQATNGQFIIQNSYHMSYPCVFKIGQYHYMIPESSANNSIDLYEATVFPYKWQHKKTLLKGAKYVDSTIYQEDGEYKLLSYRKGDGGWNLEMFVLDPVKLELKSINKIEYKENIGRPAGFLFKKGIHLIRPAQGCSSKYGEKIIFYQIDEMSENRFSEHEIEEMTYQDIEFPFAVDRIHTINRDSKYEVIDVFQERIDLLHGFNILKRAYFKK